VKSDSSANKTAATYLKSLFPFWLALLTFASYFTEQDTDGIADETLTSLAEADTTTRTP